MVRRETGGWRWPAIQFAYMTVDGVRLRVPGELGDYGLVLAGFFRGLFQSRYHNTAAVKIAAEA